MFRVAFYFDDMLSSFISGLENSNMRKVEKAADLERGTYLVLGNEIFVFSAD